MENVPVVFFFFAVAEWLSGLTRALNEAPLAAAQLGSPPAERLSRWQRNKPTRVRGRCAMKSRGSLEGAEHPATLIQVFLSFSRRPPRRRSEYQTGAVKDPGGRWLYEKTPRQRVKSQLALGSKVPVVTLERNTSCAGFASEQQVQIPRQKRI